ncbi:hypothetical protein AAC387_Pa02g2273 [Persea americana]
MLREKTIPGGKPVVTGLVEIHGMSCMKLIFVSEFFHGQRNENFYASLYAGLCYESQALVVRIDPRRVYLKNPDDAELNAVKVKKPGPPGEGYAWYQCTVPILSVKEHLSKEGIEVRM